VVFLRSPGDRSCPGFGIGLDGIGAAVEKITHQLCSTPAASPTQWRTLEKIVAQIPVGRLGEPDDIARCVVFLAADNADFVTGSTLTVNGAQYLA